MANLIITVIAIALVAVASLMGAYYGGSAFLNNQAAANASSVLNEGQQLAGAWQAYLGDNLNTPPSALSLLTTGNYLASIPTAPAAPGGVTAKTIYVGTTGNHYYAWFDVGVPGAGGASATDNNASECIRVAKTARGSASGMVFTAVAIGSIASSGTNGNNTFGCAVSSGSYPTALGGSGAAPTVGDYTVEYKLN